VYQVGVNNGIVTQLLVALRIFAKPPEKLASASIHNISKSAFTIYPTIQHYIITGDDTVVT